MKISQYIRHLKNIQREHGDLPVQKYHGSCDRIDAPAPVLDYEAVLKGRETKSRFSSSFTWEKGCDDRIGEKVCRV